MQIQIVCLLVHCLFTLAFPVLQPVYVKDDFFDSLSCDALDGGLRNGRARFSEQLRRDTEVVYCVFPYPHHYV